MLLLLCIRAQMEALAGKALSTIASSTLARHNVCIMLSSCTIIGTIVTPSKSICQRTWGGAYDEASLLTECQCQYGNNLVT